MSRPPINHRNLRVPRRLFPLVPHPLLANGRRPLIGMIHLSPLSGPYALPPEVLIEAATADAESYQQAGYDAVLIENYGDRPYTKARTLPHVAATMAIIAEHVRRTTRLHVGINVLRNDAVTALAVAHAAGCDFIRVNVLTGAVVADQGIIEGCAHELAAYRDTLGADGDKILIAADVHVKHARPLAPRSIEEEATDAAKRAGADVILVTGPATGTPVDPKDIQKVRQAVPETPVWAASGADQDNIAGLLEHAQGAIIGTAAKKQGRTTNPVDLQRARAIAVAAGKTPA
jgi:uncharacterized protein